MINDSMGFGRFQTAIFTPPALIPAQKKAELRTKGPIANTLLKIIDFGLSKCFDQGATWINGQLIGQGQDAAG